MKITFLGGVEVVTGSKYLVESDGTRILVDCGLFQGDREFTKYNDDPFPFAPESIDAIVLTHAHIDHTGYVPALVKKGFRGRVYCSQATYELCTILLLDSGALQEGYAKHRNKKADPKHPPIEPLYTKADAEYSLKFFQPVAYDTVSIIRGLSVMLIRSGHILGSAFVVVSDGKEKLTFSGDLGRPHNSILRQTPYLSEADYLVLESTYGDRLHKDGDPLGELGTVVNESVKKGGILIIPSFAVARTQTILYLLSQLRQKKIIPDIPIFLDSPMAIEVTDLLCEFKDEHILSPAACKALVSVATYTSTVEESKRLDSMEGPAIIIAGSGMVDGGRVIYHLQRYISDARNTLLFVGFQGEGTMGRLLVEGIKDLRIFGEYYPVRAQISSIRGLSAHADYEEILEWLGHFTKAPKKTFLTHGEIESARALQEKIKKRFGWEVVVPRYLEAFDLE